MAPYVTLIEGLAPFVGSTAGLYPVQAEAACAQLRAGTGGSGILGWLDLPVKVAGTLKLYAQRRQKFGPGKVLVVVSGVLGARAAGRPDRRVYHRFRPRPLCRPQPQQHLPRPASGLFGRQGLLRQRHIQVGDNHRAGHCLPPVAGAAGEKVRPGRRPPADIRHHRRRPGRPARNGGAGGVRFLRNSCRYRGEVFGAHSCGAAAHGGGGAGHSPAGAGRAQGYGELQVQARGQSCYRYAALRNILLRKGKLVELLAICEPCLHTFGEWWKQLFGESEGKDGKGLFPASVVFPPTSFPGPIHPGRGPGYCLKRCCIKETSRQVTIPHLEDDLDQLNYLAGKSMEFVNSCAFRGTLIPCPGRDAQPSCWSCRNW